MYHFQEVRQALESGDQKLYEEKLAALEELLKNRSKEQGIDTAITEEAFKPKALAERIKEAHEKMLKIENIDRLRNQVNSAARKNQKAELIDQYFEGGTPYEASANVKNYVSNLLKMSEEAFAHLKSQLKESVNPKAIEGSLIPGGDYWVVRSDGSRKLLEAVLKEVKFGEKPVVIVEVGEGEAANTREVPLAAFMEWQKNVPQAVKDQRVKARQEKEEAEKAAKEAAEASGSVGENEEDLTVNLNDPEEAHTSVLQVDKNLKEAKLRRIELLV